MGGLTDKRRMIKITAGLSQSRRDRREEKQIAVGFAQDQEILSQTYLG